MRSTLRLPGILLGLTILWIALWGDLSWANVLGGLAVSIAVVTFARLDRESLRATSVRPHWAVAYFVVLIWKLFESNLKLAWEILTPGMSTHTGIIAVPMRSGSEAVINLVANSVTLTPGTMTIDVKRWDIDGDGVYDGDEDLVILYIHGMYTRDIEAVRHDVLKLEALALRAFGTAADYEWVSKELIDHEAVLKSARESLRQNRRSS